MAFANVDLMLFYVHSNRAAVAEVEAEKLENAKIEKLKITAVSDLRIARADKLRLTNEKSVLEEKLTNYIKEVELLKSKSNSSLSESRAKADTIAEPEYMANNLTVEVESIVGKLIVDSLVDVRHLLALARKDGSNIISNANKALANGKSSNIIQDRANLLRNEIQMLRDVMVEKMQSLNALRKEVEKLKTVAGGK